MSVKFFGQFLIEQGEIDAGELCEALIYMEHRNLSLGDLAMREGLMSQAAASEINARQRSVDRPFGELAVELGHLDASQLEGLLQMQQAERVPIGEALVRLGHLASGRLGHLLDRFKADQAPYAAGEAPLPATLAGLCSAHRVVDFLPKFALRMAQLRVKVGDPRPVQEAAGFMHRIAVCFRGAEYLELALACDDDFARPLAAAACFVEVAKLGDELVADGVGEFLNVLAGNTLGALEREGLRLELEPPRFDVPLESGSEFELATSVGRALLVLRAG